jgi:site-specific recombinase XerD
LRQRLPKEKQASVNTCDTYAYAFRLLVQFASARLGRAPSTLHLEDLDAPLVLGFLAHLEETRGNGASTRNARLAAVKSFMRFVEHRVPSALAQVQRVMAIPLKRTKKREVQHLTFKEVQALLDAVDLEARDGVRDRAMLYLAFAAGLRVSELISVCIEDFRLQPTPTLLVHGKGRRERELPLWRQTATALKRYLAVRPTSSFLQLFLSGRGEPLTRAGFEYILEKYAHRARAKAPQLSSKRITPHVLRHSCAMHVLRATRDVRKVALWLGHASIQTTEIYLRADPAEKLEALAATLPPSLRRGHFRPQDALLASLQRGTYGREMRK